MFRVLIVFLFVSACSTVHVPDDFAYQEISTETFKLASWQKVVNPSARYVLYIEGDGYAFDEYGKATKNPTPHSGLVRELAFEDPNQNVIYLARPFSAQSKSKKLIG